MYMCAYVHLVDLAIQGCIMIKRRDASKKGSEVNIHSKSIGTASGGACNHSLYIAVLITVLLVFWA